MDVRTGTAFELEPPDVVFITNSGDVNNGAVGRSSTNLRIELPNLELRSISTTVTLPDSGTMLLSGLISDRKIDAKSGIPFLSDLPFIGRIFSNNYKERVRRNLLVLINAHIVLFDEEEANRQ
jgi:type II secretory pathway component GspD/PulD (secretin)